MSTPISKAGITRIGTELTGSEFYMCYEVPGEKPRQRQRQDAVSNPNVQNVESQVGSAANGSLLSNIPAFSAGTTLSTYSRPLISNRPIAASASNSFERPSQDFFENLANESDVEVIIRALQDVDINQRMESDITMLEAALKRPSQYRKIAQVLIRMGARFDLIDTHSYGMISAATLVDSRDLLKFLLGAIDTHDCDDRTLQDMHFALADALYAGRLDLALELKTSLGDIDPSRINANQLFADAVKLSNLELVEWIWDSGKLHIDALDEHQHKPPLLIAIENSAADVVEFLLSKGAGMACLNKLDQYRMVSIALLKSTGRFLSEDKRIEIIGALLGAENLPIDFNEKNMIKQDKPRTLYELAAEAGPAFVACLAEAHLRQASKRTGVPLS